MDDLISRQAAIDALMPIYKSASLRNRNVFSTARKCMAAIEDLPSAQPEIIHCGECKYYHDSDGCFFSTATTRADGFCHWAERKEGEGDADALRNVSRGIIRCKDCKHHGTNGYRLNCVVFCCTMPDDGFCSCGERREDG